MTHAHEQDSALFSLKYKNMYPLKQVEGATSNLSTLHKSSSRHSSLKELAGHLPPVGQHTVNFEGCHHDQTQARKHSEASPPTVNRPQGVHMPLQMLLLSTPAVRADQNPHSLSSKEHLVARKNEGAEHDADWNWRSMETVLPWAMRDGPC